MTSDSTSATAETDALRALLARLVPGATLTDAQPLTGGISARVHAVSFDETSAERSAEAVLRVLPTSPDLPARTEFAILRWVSERGIAAPRAIASCEPVPEAPGGALLCERLPGETISAPDDAGLLAMARWLRTLHALGEPPRNVLAPAPRPPVPDAWPAEDPARTAPLKELAARLPPPPTGGCLCHGDFWPGNVLWSHGRLSGVVDWEDAFVGDRVEDLAIARLELLWATNGERMDAFTDAYLADDPDAEQLRARLPAADLVAALQRLAWLRDWSLMPPAQADWCAALALMHAEAAAEALGRL